MLVKVSVGSKSFPIEIGKDDGSISTLGELKSHISKEANIESSCMKIIHRGKTITGEDDLSLVDMNFKENDKILIMGKVSSSLKDDPGFSALVAYEKANLLGLQKQHEQIESDLSAMELNFLDEITGDGQENGEETGTLYGDFNEASRSTGWFKYHQRRYKRNPGYTKP
nr:Ubiquitin domain containing protein [Haemonchus contortus]